MVARPSRLSRRFSSPGAQAHPYSGADVGRSTSPPVGVRLQARRNYGNLFLQGRNQDRQGLGAIRPHGECATLCLSSADRSRDESQDIVQQLELVLPAPGPPCLLMVLASTGSATSASHGQLQCASRWALLERQAPRPRDLLRSETAARQAHISLAARHNGLSAARATGNGQDATGRDRDDYPGSTTTTSRRADTSPLMTGLRLPRRTHPVKLIRPADHVSMPAVFRVLVSESAQSAPMPPPTIGGSVPSIARRVLSHPRMLSISTESNDLSRHGATRPTTR
ncbi:uncharacterized protein PSFLO_01838 [Pseudozyma flocculosa]|uniref:Uncharacterized protein n=1 Tax=Pseudozyma flocculosa TaxID=84751 RepID=A0A5C3EY92_9BASI|nr:uncharacterized protein PSFLO_01838 [Pseudozyma flocculosa]